MPHPFTLEHAVTCIWHARAEPEGCLLAVAIGGDAFDRFSLTRSAARSSEPVSRSRWTAVRLPRVRAPSG